MKKLPKLFLILLMIFNINNQSKKEVIVVYLRYVQPGYYKRLASVNENNYKRKYLPYFEVLVYKSKDNTKIKEKEIESLKIEEKIDYDNNKKIDGQRMELVSEFKIYLKKNLYEIPQLENPNKKYQQRRIYLKLNLIYYFIHSEFIAFQFKFQSIYFDKNLGMVTKFKPFFVNKFLDFLCISQSFQNNMVFLADHYDPLYESFLDTHISINIFENCTHENSINDEYEQL
jgi:hypothetical protein